MTATTDDKSIPSKLSSNSVSRKKQQLKLSMLPTIQFIQRVMQHLRVQGIYTAPWSPPFRKHVQNHSTVGATSFYNFYLWLQSLKNDQEIFLVCIIYLLQIIEMLQIQNQIQGWGSISSSNNILPHCVAMVPPICDIHVVVQGNCNNNNTRDPKSIIMIYDCLGYIAYNYFFHSYRSKVLFSVNET